MPRKILFGASLIISVLCLAIGYEPISRWAGVVLLFLLTPFWLLARKHPNSWLPFLCLLTSVGLGVTGRLLGAPSLWMVLGPTVALSAWDLLLLDAALGNTSSGKQTRRYEKIHIRSLILALSFGLLLIFFGNSLNIRMPFIVLILLVAFILFALDRVWAYIKKAGKRSY